MTALDPDCTDVIHLCPTSSAPPHHHHLCGRGLSCVGWKCFLCFQSSRLCADCLTSTPLIDDCRPAPPTTTTLTAAPSPQLQEVFPLSGIIRSHHTSSTTRRWLEERVKDKT